MTFKLHKSLLQTEKCLCILRCLERHLLQRTVLAREGSTYENCV